MNKHLIQLTAVWVVAGIILASLKFFKTNNEE